MATSVSQANNDQTIPGLKKFKIRRSSPTFFARLGLPDRGESLYRKIHNGFEYRIYADLNKYMGIPQKEFNKILGFAPATVERRKGGLFNLKESDKLYRLAEITRAAIDLFEGDEDKARDWLKRPVKGLGGKRPLDMLGSTAETESILELIGRLEHGVFS